MQRKIEFTKQERLPTQLSNLTTRNDEPIYQALQVAYLHDGAKYPTPFNFRLYQGPDKAKADAAMPHAVGFYTLKDDAIGVAYQNLNCDFSMIEPLQSQATKVA